MSDQTSNLQNAMSQAFETFKLAKSMLDKNDCGNVESVDCYAYFKSDGTLSDNDSGPIVITFREYCRLKKL